MTLELAEQLLAAVKVHAAEAGFAAAAVVVDAGGYPVALFRQDGCRLLTVDVALGKAYAAAAYRMDSGRLADLARQEPAFWTSVAAATGNRLVLGAGGVPVLVDGAVVGALAVSGGTPIQDAELARTALAAVLGQ